MFHKTRLFSAAALLAGAFSFAAGAHPAAAAPAAQAGPQTWTVMVGQAITTTPGEKPAWQAMKFYPANLTIHEGDTVVWKSNSDAEPHTVTFLGPETTAPPEPVAEPNPAGGAPLLMVNPKNLLRTPATSYDGSAFVNSGFMASDIPGPKDYSLSFPKAGAYGYYCALHGGPGPDGKLQGMAAMVTVAPAGAALPQTPAQVDAAVTAAMQADKDAAVAAEPQAKASATSSSPGPNGTTVYHVRAGYMDMEHGLDYMRFSPSDLTIHAGDSVEWTSDSLHTVSFGATPEFILLQPQPNGPPKAQYNPEAALPMGGQTHTGSGVYNSGLLLAELPPGAPPFMTDKFTLTFTQPGSYGYVCSPHLYQGMGGNITVLAATSGAPGMPTTGAGADGLWVAGAVAGGLSLLLAGVALRRRQGATGA
jgi:plastocyanin